MKKQLLIGGQALVKLGSSRQTKDVDYMVSEANLPLFSHDIKNNIDYINAAAGNKFFSEIWKKEEKNNGEMATPASLLELKAYSLVQHCLNGFWAKADDAEYDIKFLVRTFNLPAPTIVKKYVTAGEYSEIEKIVNSVKK